MILTIDHGPVRELRLNRPPVNALTSELLMALREAIESAPHDGIRVLILSGAPGRFSAGLDVPLLLGQDRPAMAVLWRELYALLQAIAASPIPIAAALTGHAPAGGTVIALFCDWRVMAQEEYKLGLNEVQVGIPLPPVLLGALRRLLGSRQAERLAVSGILISPQEALRIGLVDDLASMSEVVQRSLEWCQRILSLPPEAMLATRREARADLLQLFEVNLEPEIQRVIENWWNPSTQSTLRALVERMGKRASS
jgi:Delta3-Delta2-enoyl-CoA isomerase